jgi:serine/threonine protein kinase
MNYVKRYDIRRSPDWVVWRGEHPESRHLCTVKEVNAEAEAPEQLLARLQEEFDFFSAFDHPHLLRPLRLEVAERRILFEDAQCSLDQYLLSHGPLTPTQAANLLLHCAEALERLHARRLGHGAICTHTILVGPQGEAKFGDFLGYPFARAAALPVPDYEPKYQAPELIDSSQGPCSSLSDLYCLGYAALEMLAGEQFASLFGEDVTANWLAWHADPNKDLGDWRASLFRVPKGLLDIIAALIEKDIANRHYRSAGQLRSDLERSRLNSGERLPPYQPGQPMPTPRQRKRRGPPVPPRPAGTRPSIALLGRGVDSAAPRHWFRPGRPVLVGRGSDCDLQLPQASVSRKHALLVSGEDGRWWVHDLGSRMGTRVNGAKVAKSRVRDGDEVALGDALCRVYLSGVRGGLPNGLCGFELGDQIHEGAHGRLYRANWSARDGREVLVRIYPPAFQFDDTGIRRFMRAIPEAGLIRHPNVVRHFRGGYLRSRDGNTTWFLAMEYLTGGSLRDRLAAAGPMPAAEVIRFATDVSRALTQAAARGLVHRNLTPSCILFDPAGAAKLGDFSLLRGGVLSELQEITRASAPPGEHTYQAPEQLMGVSELGPACDLYALGASMYEALTGQPPFPREMPFTDLVQAVCKEPVRPPRDLIPAIPAGLNDLVERTLAKDVQRRFGSPREFRAALRGLGPA